MEANNNFYSRWFLNEMRKFINTIEKRLDQILEQLVEKTKKQDGNECFLCLVNNMMSNKISKSLVKANADLPNQNKQELSSLQEEMQMKMRNCLSYLVNETMDKALEKAKQNSMTVCRTCSIPKSVTKLFLLKLDPFLNPLHKWKTKNNFKSPFGRQSELVMSYLNCTDDEHHLLDGLQKQFRLLTKQTRANSSVIVRSSNSELDRWIFEFDKMQLNTGQVIDEKSMPLEVNYGKYFGLLSNLIESVWKIVVMNKFGFIEINEKFKDEKDLDIIHAELVKVCFIPPNWDHDCFLCSFHRLWWNAEITWLHQKYSRSIFHVKHRDNKYILETYISDVKKAFKFCRYLRLQYCALYLILHSNNIYCMSCWLRFDIYLSDVTIPIRFPLQFVKRMGSIVK